MMRQVRDLRLTGEEATSLATMLDWYRRSGVDAAIHDIPTSSASLPHEQTREQTHDIATADGGHSSTRYATERSGLREESSRPSDRTGTARSIARGCASLAELEQALADFEGCPLKRTANRLCFADGDPRADLMLVGEAPGSEEDRQGKPFVGPSGKLLDRMLATIGLERARVWITNVIFWRPPGNRAPTAAELAVCLPFLERQIELIEPRLLLFVGGTAARALLGVEQGVTKLRGRRFLYKDRSGSTTPALVTFHPAYLLRQPLQKKLAWRDLRTAAEMLKEQGSGSIH